MKTQTLFLVVINIALAQMYYAQNGMYQQPMTYQQPMMVQPYPTPNLNTVPVTSNTPDTTTPAEQCAHGACCSSTKTFLPAGEPCRATTNPCEETARCNGASAECPENPRKSNGSSCMINGQCTDGFCTEYVCTGLCCVDGKIAPDGTLCGEEDAKCVSGTCTVYRKADPHVRVLTDEEKEIIKAAQKQVKGEFESLLRSHAKYLLQKFAFEASTKESTLEQIEHKIGLTNVTTPIAETLNLQSGNDQTNNSVFSSSSWKYTTLFTGLGLVAVAVVIIFVINPKGKQSAQPRKAKAPKKKTKSEDMSSADYDPPAF